MLNWLNINFSISHFSQSSFRNSKESPKSNKQVISGDVGPTFAPRNLAGMDLIGVSDPVTHNG